VKIDDFRGVSETDNWRSGKKRSRKPGFVPPAAETVTIVIGEKEALRFFGALDRAELTRHLKDLRARGLLVHEKDRLTSQVKVRGHDGGVGHVRGIVVRGRRHTVPQVSDKLRRETRKRRGERPMGRLIRL
jgi:hypothetical protein